MRLRRRHPRVQGDRREPHPRLTSSATVRAVKGRAALGISALPDPSGAGSANTVW